MIILKSPRELGKMRSSGRIAARVLREVSSLIKSGVTTGELDKAAGRIIGKMGATSGSRGYKGYPGFICVSVNEEVVHGIGGSRRLEEGDIVSLDVVVRYQGYYGDTAATFPVGKISREKERLIRVTEASLYAGIDHARVGHRLYDISAAVQARVEGAGFSVVRDFVGHGIGTEMHEDPPVPNFGPGGEGISLKKGMVIAIEPMVNKGVWEVDVREDGWTVVTRDHLPSAHFEHTVAITAAGPEIMTWLEKKQ